MGASDDRNGESEATRSDGYWRRRFYNFLSKVRELKAVPKKEKMLEDRFTWVS